MSRFRLPLPIARMAYRAIGAGIAIGLMELLGDSAGVPLAYVPFVTSIILVTALPHSDAARIKAIVGGHLMSALAGALVVRALNPGETAAAISVGLATVAMMATDTLHPPAGINAFLVGLLGLPFKWIGMPVLFGAVLLALYARVWSLGERRLLGGG